MNVEKLEHDLVNALKNHDKTRLTVLRSVKAGMTKESIDKKREINDELFIDIISREIKVRNEEIAEFTKGGREDLVKKSEEEKKILEEYLPEQLSLEEVESIILEVINSIDNPTIKDMGKVMGEVTPKLKGKTDMSKVSSIVKEKLG